MKRAVLGLAIAFGYASVVRAQHPSWLAARKAATDGTAFNGVMANGKPLVWKDDGGPRAVVFAPSGAGQPEQHVRLYVKFRQADKIAGLSATEAISWAILEFGAKVPAQRQYRFVLTSGVNDPGSALLNSLWKDWLQQPKKTMNRVGAMSWRYGFPKEQPAFFDGLIEIGRTVNRGYEPDRQRVRLFLMYSKPEPVAMGILARVQTEERDNRVQHHVLAGPTFQRVHRPLFLEGGSLLTFNETAYTAKLHEEVAKRFVQHDSMRFELLAIGTEGIAMQSGNRYAIVRAVNQKKLKPQLGMREFNALPPPAWYHKLNPNQPHPKRPLAIANDPRVGAVAIGLSVCSRSLWNTWARFPVDPELWATPHP